MTAPIDIFLNRLAAPSGATAAGPRRIPITSGARPAAFSSPIRRAVIDASMHMIVVRHPNGAYVPERNVFDLDLESTIKDIMEGQVEDVEHVFAFNPAEHTCSDVTEDIAIEIASRVAGESIHRFLFDFIETHAGADYARGLRVREDVFAGE